MHIYILSFLLEKRKSTHLPNHTPLPGNQNESGCCLSLLAFIFSPSFHAGLYFCYCTLTRYSWRYFLLFFSSPCSSRIVQSPTPQKESPVQMKSFSHSQVAPHIPSQPFRMMQRGGAAGGLWPCTIGDAGPLLSLLWDTRPQDLSLLCLKRREVRRCTSQCLFHPLGHLSIPLT